MGLNKEAAQERSISPDVEFTVPKKGTIILLPVDNAEAFKLIKRESLAWGTIPEFYGVELRFKGSNGEAISLTIESTPDQPNQINPLEVLKDTPHILRMGLNRIIQTSPKGKLLPLGTPILETSIDNATVKIKMGNTVAQNPTLININRGINIIKTVDQPSPISSSYPEVL
jgi:hypothetical protein